MIKRLTKEILEDKLSNPETVFNFLKGLNWITGHVRYNPDNGIHKIMIWYPEDLSNYHLMIEDRNFLSQFQLGGYTLFKIGGNGYSTALTVFVEVKKVKN